MSLAPASGLDWPTFADLSEAELERRLLGRSATDVLSASRRISTICSSVNRLFLTGSSFSMKSHLSRNYRDDGTGQIRTSKRIRAVYDYLADALPRAIQCRSFTQATIRSKTLALRLKPSVH